MITKILEKCKESIITYTGFHQFPKGKLIGYGRKIEEEGISHSEADMLLENDLYKIEKELTLNLGFWDELDEIRKVVLLEMVFNLGMVKFMQFRKMLSALQEFDYQKAASEILDSKWASQSSRAEVLAYRMYKGRF